MSESRPVAPIHVIGGGLAGSEAAWQIARQNVPVVVHEMRPDAQPRPIAPAMSIIAKL
jgi:methylenetetrahydrofolate--tRNA-(uracil-5-)-methyltransferase